MTPKAPWGHPQQDGEDTTEFRYRNMRLIDRELEYDIK